MGGQAAMHGGTGPPCRNETPARARNSAGVNCVYSWAGETDISGVEIKAQARRLDTPSYLVATVNLHRSRRLNVTLPASIRRRIGRSWIQAVGGTR